MEKSSRPLRVCPIFKLFWVSETKVINIKRYDYYKPFVTLGDLFAIIKEVYKHFDSHSHVLKYRDGDDLVDISISDDFSFQFTETFYLVSIYIFSSHESAREFIPTWVSRPEQPPDISCVRESLIQRIRNALVPASVRSPRPTASTGPAIQEVHPDVECKMCRSTISSTRYLCLECADFDLCADCEKDDAHEHHLKVAVPIHFLISQGALYQSIVESIVASARKSIPHTIE